MCGFQHLSIIEYTTKCGEISRRLFYLLWCRCA